MICWQAREKRKRQRERKRQEVGRTISISAKEMTAASRRAWGRHSLMVLPGRSVSGLPAGATSWPAWEREKARARRRRSKAAGKWPAQK